MSIIGEQEEEAQKRLIAAEDALRREASSHDTSSELSVRPPPHTSVIIQCKHVQAYVCRVACDRSKCSSSSSSSGSRERVQQG